MPSDLAWTAQGAGPPLVLLHGGGPGCSALGDFAGILEALTPHRTVYAIDLHQYGASPSVRIAGPAVDHHASAVAGLLDELGVAGADVIAQSLGSLVALRLGETRPELVRRLVLTGVQPMQGDPVHSNWTLGPRVRSRLFAPGAIDDARMATLLSEAEWFNIERIPQTLVQRRLEVALRHHAVVRGDDADGRGTPQRIDASLPRVAHPVLLLWGAADRFATPTYARAVAELLPDARVEVIDAAAHHVQSERPEAFARAALAHLLAA